MELHLEAVAQGEYHKEETSVVEVVPVVFRLEVVKEEEGEEEEGAEQAHSPLPHPLTSQKENQKNVCPSHQTTPRPISFPYHRQEARLSSRLFAEKP